MNGRWMTPRYLGTCWRMKRAGLKITVRPFKAAFKTHSTAVKCWRKVPAFQKWQAGVRTSKTDSLFKAVIPSSTTEAQAWHSAQHTRRRATIYSTFTK